MIVYKIKFDENRPIHFLIKEEKVFSFLEILEKVGNVNKNNFNSKLIYSTKYLKAEINK